MGTKTLTSANAILMLSAVGLFDTPVQIQGFATEDIYDADGVDVAETVLGADGNMSAGWIPNKTKVGYSIQADSDSIQFFERLYYASQAVREVYFLDGSIYLRAVGRKYSLNRGIMTNYKPLPDGKKILQPRKFMIDWNSITGSSI